MSFGHLGALGRGFGKLGSPAGGTGRPLPFMSDGGSNPWISGNQGPPAVHDASTNLTWLLWERGIAAANKRIVSVRTRNSSTGIFSSEYTAGITTLVGDAHGDPVAATVKGSGFCFAFYGAHSSALQIASNAVANDPSTWFDQPPITGQHTFPNVVGDSSKIYLIDSTGSAANGGTQNALEMIVCSPSGGTLNPGTAKQLLDAWISSGNPGWIVPIGAQENPAGTEINFLFTYATTFAGTITAIYFARYVKATGALMNYSGGFSVAAASQPVTQASFSNFLVANVTDGDPPALCFDLAGNPHVTFDDGSGLENATLYHTVGNGSTWSAREAVYTFNVSIDTQIINSALVANAAGGIDIYWPDGAAGYAASPGIQASGNMLTVTRSSGGAYGAVKTLLTMAGQGLDNATAVLNGPPSLQVVFSEVTSDFVTISGTLKGYAYGTGGFVGVAPVVNSAQANAFAARLPGGLSAGQLGAYNEFINGLVTDSNFSKFDFLQWEASESTTAAALNLVSASFPISLVGAPTFTARDGYSGCTNATKFLDPNFNPSTAGGNFSQNSCALIAFALSGVTTDGVIIGSNDDTAGTSFIVPNGANSMFAAATVAVDIDAGIGSVATSGMFAVSRTAAGSYIKSINGVTVQTVTEASSPPQNSKITIGGGYTATFHQWSGNIAMTGAGGGFTANQLRQIYLRSIIYLNQINA